MITFINRVDYSIWNNTSKKFDNLTREEVIAMLPAKGEHWLNNQKPKCEALGFLKEGKPKGTPVKVTSYGYQAIVPEVGRYVAYTATYKKSVYIEQYKQKQLVFIALETMLCEHKPQQTSAKVEAIDANTFDMPAPTVPVAPIVPPVSPVEQAPVAPIIVETSDL